MTELHKILAGRAARHEEKLAQTDDEGFFLEKEAIERWLKSHDIESYSFQPNSLVVNVDGQVNLWSKRLTQLPVRFGEVAGTFNVGKNRLTTLKGCPHTVLDSFHCFSNELTSLEFAPSHVKGAFVCSNNPLISLEFSPREVTTFVVKETQISTLEHGPLKVRADYDCSTNVLVSLKGAPEEVPGNFNCNGNDLTTLQYAPKEVGRTADFRNNPLTDFTYAPEKAGALSLGNYEGLEHQPLPSLLTLKTQIETELNICWSSFLLPERSEEIVHTQAHAEKVRIEYPGENLTVHSELIGETRRGTEVRISWKDLQKYCLHNYMQESLNENEKKVKKIKL